jgi:anti-repressor protein
MSNFSAAIQTFNFENDQPIRIIIGDDGEPHWIGADVCRALQIRNSSDALSRLDDDERGEVGIADVTGRKQDQIAITESGVYSLIIRSRTERSKSFRRWVTSEVLPAIRKTGKYEMSRPLTEEEEDDRTTMLLETMLRDHRKVLALQK